MASKLALGAPKTITILQGKRREVSIIAHSTSARHRQPVPGVWLIASPFDREFINRWHDRWHHPVA
jgi:hypothetical protein